MLSRRIFLLSGVPLATAFLAACQQIGQVAVSTDGEHSGEPAAAGEAR